MSQPPPENLMDWPKSKLAKEVARLRALVREHSERPGDDPRVAATTGAMIGGDDPHGHGTVLLDTRSAVLLDEVDVSLVDTKRDDPLAMMMVLAGRMNYGTDRVEHAYLFGADGAAGVTSEITALVSRCATGSLPHGRAFADAFREYWTRREDDLRRSGGL
jgi:hypothetical protein